MQESEKISVLIVDDHDMLREGLSTFLGAFEDLTLVGEANNGIRAIQQCRELKPDVVLMDLVMPGMDGVAAIESIHRAQPEIQIIALSSFGEERLVRSALNAGATSYLLKNISAEKLADAIRSTRSGLPTLAPEITQVLLDSNQSSAADPLAQLTQRESEVLYQLRDGLSNAQIARVLNISIFTIKNHISSILSKLGVSSRAEAINLAHQENWGQRV